MQRVNTEHINEFLSTINFELIKDCYNEIGENPWKIVFIPFLLVGTILYFVYMIIYGLYFVLSCLQHLPDIVAERTDSGFLVVLSFIIFPFGWIVSVSIIIVPIVILTVLQIIIMIFIFPFLISTGTGKMKKEKISHLTKVPKKILGSYEHYSLSTNVFLRIDAKGNYLLKYKNYQGVYEQKGKFDCYKFGTMYIINFLNNSASSLLFNEGYITIEKKKAIISLRPYGITLEKIKL